MANRLSKEKAGLIASNYCTNQYKKVQALLDAGYSTTYANNVGLKLFDNDRVKEAICRIEADKRLVTGYTVQQCQQEYEEARQRAVELKQVAAEISAITGKARLYGMDKDNNQAQAQQPDTLTIEEIEAYKAAAKAITAPKLAKQG